MSQHLSRPLNNKDLVDEFLARTLQFDSKKTRGIIDKIVDGEIGVINSNIHPQTIQSTSFRDRRYKDDIKRWEMRKDILRELYSLKRLEDDEDIVAGKGGALPFADIKNNKQAIIITGLPASGKSTVAAKMAERYGAVIVDSDYAKRKMPEFKKHLYGATVVHEESSQLTFGFKIDNPDNVKSLYEMCLAKGQNIIIPKIGQSPGSIFKLAQTLKNENGYAVHLILVTLPKREATIRAIYRYNKTKRYVPLGLIFDGYGNDPTLCYWYLRCKFADHFQSFGCLSNDVPQGKDPVCTDMIGDSPAGIYEFKELIL